MLRKTLTLGMVFILALSLLVVSMITCFTYEAEAAWDCYNPETEVSATFDNHPGDPWDCDWFTQ